MSSKVTLAISEDMEHLANNNNPVYADYVKEMTEVAAKLESIIDLLGEGWTATVHQHRGFHLDLNGGWINPDGISLYGRPVGYQSEQDTYWKYNISGDYPKTERYEDQMYVSDKPQAGITISNPTSAAKQIKSRLVGPVTELTEKSRKHNAEVAARRSRYNANIDRIWRMTNHSTKLGEHNYQSDSFRTSEFILEHYVAAELRSHNTVDMSISGLSVDETEEVLLFLRNRDNRTYEFSFINPQGAQVVFDGYNSPSEARASLACMQRDLDSAGIVGYSFSDVRLSFKDAAKPDKVAPVSKPFGYVIVDTNR